jgi:hypothetical protein
MLIELHSKTIFFENPKCASTSIVNAFNELGLYSKDLHCSLAQELGSTSLSKHISVRAYTKRVAPILDEMGIDTSEFAYYGIVRYPLDWLYSWFRFKSSDKYGEQSTRGLDFASFLEAYLIEDPMVRPKHGTLTGNLRTQSQFYDYSAGEGRLPVNLYKLDHISTFVNDLSQRVGQSVSLKRLNKSPSPSNIDLELPASLRLRVLEYLDDDCRLYQEAS